MAIPRATVEEFRRELRVQVNRIISEFEAVSEELRLIWEAAEWQLRQENGTWWRRMLWRRERVAEWRRRKRVVEELRQFYVEGNFRLSRERHFIETFRVNPDLNPRAIEDLFSGEVPSYVEKLLGRHSESLSVFASGGLAKATENNLTFVSIYLANEDIHEQVESAVEEWLALTFHPG